MKDSRWCFTIAIINFVRIVRADPNSIVEAACHIVTFVFVVTGLILYLIDKEVEKRKRKWNRIYTSN